MSKNASSDSDASREPDNPQETLKVKVQKTFAAPSLGRSENKLPLRSSPDAVRNFYYAGFCAAEMSCSVIKATNSNPVGHHYYAIDFTVSNADKNLLQKVNRVVMQKHGVISQIKGAFNLSARGKKRVKIVLNFLVRYPIVAGDLARRRTALLMDALEYLEVHRGAHSHQAKTGAMDAIRKELRRVKETGTASKSHRAIHVNHDAVGHFLAGVLDGEGSFGFKKSGHRQQPFLAVAMKDKKVIELFPEFLRHGNVRRRNDGMYHYEINHTEVLKKVCTVFLTQYPLQHTRQRERMQKLQRILNDYTRNRLLNAGG